MCQLDEDFPWFVLEMPEAALALWHVLSLARASAEPVFLNPPTVNTEPTETLAMRPCARPVANVGDASVLIRGSTLRAWLPQMSPSRCHVAGGTAREPLSGGTIDPHNMALERHKGISNFKCKPGK